MKVFRHQLPHMENQYIAIGHVRYSTTGSSLLANTQPLIANYCGGKISLAHNGNLTNAAEIRRSLEEQEQSSKLLLIQKLLLIVLLVLVNLLLK